MQSTPREKSENSVNLLNFIADPIGIVDEKNRTLLVNDAFVAFTGLSRDKVLGKVLYEVGNLSEESKRKVLENFKKRMQGLPVQPYEVAFTNEADEIKHVEIKARKIDYAGKPADLVVFRDITRRKRNLAKIQEYAEKMETLVEEKVKEIKKSEEKYRELTESIGDVFFALDKDLRFTYWNKASEENAGIPAKDVLGKSLIEVFPNTEKTSEQIIQNVLRTKQAQSFLTNYKIGDKEFFFEINVYPTIAGLSIFVKDITKRKKMEAEVKQQLDMLESLTENLGVGFVIISKDYHVLWANKFIKNNVGNVGKVEGKLCYSSLNSLDHTCPDCGVRKVFEEGVERDAHEHININIHGKPYYVEIIATPLKDKDGNVTAALEFVVDITEKKRMQDKLTEYSQKLEKLVDEKTEELKQTQAKLLKAEKLAAIGELAGLIGHDLRNPLTGIKGATYYLKTKYTTELDATGKEMLKTIEKAIEHANKIINDLLDYSGKLTIELTETTPKILLKDTLASTKIPARIHIVDATKSKPKIKVDVGSMHKVFANIIINAIDAMPNTGTLTITSKTADDKVKIVFKDTGTGMSPETLSKMWIPLFTTKARGMGFGLPIAKRIVEAHGGNISLKSTLGKGTAVTITIPINPQLLDEYKEKWILTDPMLRALPASQETA